MAKIRSWSAILITMLVAGALPAVAAAQTTVFSAPLTGAPPTIDGVIDPAGEWPGPPALQLRLPNYPIDTDVTFLHDAAYLYVLVHATGDTTDSTVDECLLVFDLPPLHKIVEIWQTAPGGCSQTRFTNGAVGDSAMGMSAGVRVYEFRIELASIGLQPGGAVPFYSPAVFKGPGVIASMPYDGGDPNETSPQSRDNVYPYDLEVDYDSQSPFEIEAIRGYSLLRLGEGEATAVPTLNAWGMALFGLLALASGTVFLRRKSA